jgi:4-nitrophenyl phosphatase
MNINSRILIALTIIALVQYNHCNAFVIHHNHNHQRTKLNVQINGINGETTSTPTPTINEKTEKIRSDALSEYEKVMEHFMFELGNDTIFLSNQQEVHNYIKSNFDTIIFDCDGVLYRGGDNPIPEAKEALRDMLTDDSNGSDNNKKQILFLTNNAQYSREGLRDKLSNILNSNTNVNESESESKSESLLELTTEQMITSSYATAKYLENELCKSKNKKNEECNIYVIGSSGLCQEIQNFGFNVKSSSEIMSSSSSSSSSSQSSMDRNELASYTFQDEEEKGNSNGSIDAIVVGLDTDFTYRKLCIVTSLLQRHPNALFIATNEDAFDVVDGIANNDNDTSTSTSTTDKRNLPGNGAIVKSIEIASQRNAINVGKPSKTLVDLLENEYEFDRSRTLMVGDRLDTDVKFGKDGGMKSALVLTGCTTAQKLMDIGVGTEDEPLPHIIFPHMGMMMGGDD